MLIAVCKMPETKPNVVALDRPIPQKFASGKSDKTNANEPNASCHFLL
jgi:hypothetical protein